MVCYVLSHTVCHLRNDLLYSVEFCLRLNIVAAVTAVCDAASSSVYE